MPYKEDMFNRVVNVKWQTLALVDITYPEDIDVDLKVGSFFLTTGRVPAQALYAAGAEVLASAFDDGGDSSVFMYEVFFEEDNPISVAHGGFWDRQPFFITTLTDFSSDIPTFDVVDLIDPNP